MSEYNRAAADTCAALTVNSQSLVYYYAAGDNMLERGTAPTYSNSDITQVHK